jgi:hypothetical protein
MRAQTTIPITEAGFMLQVQQLARLYGWRVHLGKRMPHMVQCVYAVQR